MKKLGFISIIVFFSGNLFSQKVLISTAKTNVFYQWIENPLSISVENYSCEDLVAKADKGILTGSQCDYIYVTDSYNITKVKITVGVKRKGKIKWIDSMAIRVKSLPDPEPMLGMFGSGDTIPKAAFPYNTHINLPMSSGWELYGDCEKQDIISFTFKVKRNDSTIFQESYTNPKGFCDTFNYGLYDSLSHDYIFTSDFSREAFNLIYFEGKKGDRIIIENIVALLYRKEKRILRNMSFILW